MPSKRLGPEGFTIHVLWSELKRMVAYGVVCAIITIGLAFGVAAIVGNDVADSTNHTAVVVLEQARETQALLCDILRNAETKEIRQAVAEYCPVALDEG